MSTYSCQVGQESAREVESPSKDARDRLTLPGHDETKDSNDEDVECAPNENGAGLIGEDGGRWKHRCSYGGGEGRGGCTKERAIKKRAGQRAKREFGGVSQQQPGNTCTSGRQYGGAKHRLKGTPAAPERIIALIALIEAPAQRCCIAFASHSSACQGPGGVPLYREAASVRPMTVPG